MHSSTHGAPRLDADLPNPPSMQPLKAHVHNGRLVLDEPTDLPEGDVVYLQLIVYAAHKSGFIRRVLLPRTEYHLYYRFAPTGTSFWL